MASFWAEPEGKDLHEASGTKDVTLDDGFCNVASTMLVRGLHTLLRLRLPLLGFARPQSSWSDFPKEVVRD